MASSWQGSRGLRDSLSAWGLPQRPGPVATAASKVRHGAVRLVVHVAVVPAPELEDSSLHVGGMCRL